MQTAFSHHLVCRSTSEDHLWGQPLDRSVKLQVTDHQNKGNVLRGGTPL